MQKSRLPLPIGISDYRVASSEYYYVDKTMMLKTFLDERPMVSLFTRPRRFGKTLNMDIQLMPKNNHLPGILIELKAEKNCNEADLKKLAETAVKQIENQRYDTEMTTKGIKVIYKYGVAFSGKTFEVAVK